MSHTQEAWRSLPLSDITSSISNGLTHQNNPASGGLPLSRIQTISKGEIDFELVGYAGLEETGVEKYLLKPGDILFSHINSKEHVGKVAIYKARMPPLLHGMNLLRIVANEKVLPRYLFWALRSDKVKNQIWDNTRHAVNQASINIRNLSNVVVPVPPLDEQDRIVEVLDDNLSRLEKALAELDHADSQTLVFRRSILNTLLSSQVSGSEQGFGPMADSSNSWQTKRLDEVAKVIRGVTYSSGQVLTPNSPNALMLLRATNIQDGKLDTHDPVYIPKNLVKPSQLLQQHDIVIASSSGSIQVVGKSASVLQPLEATFGAFCTGIRATGINPRYLAHYLQDPTLRQTWSDLASGSNINNLKSTDIASTSIPMPPLDDQNGIVDTLDDHLSRLDSTRTSIASLKASLQTLRRSLLNQAFNGELGTK
jgi:type I restriction enzyme S subunit